MPNRPTTRPIGRATAGHLGSVGGTRYIFGNRAEASCRSAPVNSNVSHHMPRPFLFAVSVPLLSSLSGCATPPPYIAPTSGATALIDFETSVTVATRHAYVSKNGTCAGRENVNGPTQVRVPTSEQVLVQQGFYSNWGTHTLHCNLAVTFSPKSGERYVSTYQMNGETRQCQIGIWHLGADGKRSPELSAVSVTACPEP